MTWQTVLGPVVYVAEYGQTAVLEYALPFGDNIGRIYLDGLGGEFGGPGPVEGYWSEPDVSHDDDDDQTLICPFAIIDDHGRTTRNWGRIRFMLPGEEMPGDIVLLRGRCFQEPAEIIAGRLAG